MLYHQIKKYVFLKNKSNISKKYIIIIEIAFDKFLDKLTIDEQYRYYL